MRWGEDVAKAVKDGIYNEGLLTHNEEESGGDRSRS